MSHVNGLIVALKRWLALWVFFGIQEKGIHMIVQHLGSDAVHTAWHAGCILANLAACNLSIYHSTILKAGALEPLLALLKKSPDEQSTALGAIRNLTSDTNWQVQFLQWFNPKMHVLEEIYCSDLFKTSLHYHIAINLSSQNCFCSSRM